LRVEVDREDSIKPGHKRIVANNNDADVSMSVEELEAAFYGVELVTA